jgi:hypothetical protein
LSQSRIVAVTNFVALSQIASANRNRLVTKMSQSPIIAVTNCRRFKRQSQFDRFYLLRPWGIHVGCHAKFLMNVYFEKRWEQGSISQNFVSAGNFFLENFHFKFLTNFSQTQQIHIFI